MQTSASRRYRNRVNSLTELNEQSRQTVKCNSEKEIEGNKPHLDKQGSGKLRQSISLLRNACAYKQSFVCTVCSVTEYNRTIQTCGTFDLVRCHFLSSIFFRWPDAIDLTRLRVQDNHQWLFKLSVLYLRTL